MIKHFYSEEEIYASIKSFLGTLKTSMVPSKLTGVKRTHKDLQMAFALAMSKIRVLKKIGNDDTLRRAIEDMRAAHTALMNLRRRYPHLVDPSVMQTELGV